MSKARKWSGLKKVWLGVARDDMSANKLTTMDDKERSGEDTAGKRTPNSETVVWDTTWNTTKIIIMIMKN